MISSEEYRSAGAKIAQLKREVREADIEFVNYCYDKKCKQCIMFKESKCDTPVYLEYKERGLIE